MTLRELFNQSKRICYLRNSAEVYKTSAGALADIIGKSPSEIYRRELRKTDILICNASGLNLDIKSDDFVFMKFNETGGGLISADKDYFINAYIQYLVENTDFDCNEYFKGKLFKPAFNWNRMVYDYFLTQEGRLQKGFDRKRYISEMARLGFTHLEVNGLAFPSGNESGPKGETYPMFYTYCPALDQFSASNLNKGIYDNDYLAKNMAYMKENADEGRKYGLVPGMLCFEPRSVPEELFNKYPMLRGARVDHPFRSFKPRYILTTSHPKVKEHYRQLVHNIMKNIPDLGFISIWTNDSGAGFEHTKSLYVGRNGGPYLIREWNDDESIAKIAAENALDFFRTLRDAGREINPDFKVITRMESFYGEHNYIWNGLEDGIEIETNSLITKGWSINYHHPKYKDIDDINGGTIYSLSFNKEESIKAEQVKKKKSDAHFYHTSGPRIIFEPLLGVPYPKLTYRRLKIFNTSGVKKLAQTGGTLDPELVSYNINHEITKEFILDNNIKINDIINKYAVKWAGKENKEIVLRAWKNVEESIINFPGLTPLYLSHGFTWYRLWVRPLVPNYEILPIKTRSYYENYMCTTPHNPNNIDLSRDVLFKLTNEKKSSISVEYTDKYCLPPLKNAIDDTNDFLINEDNEFIFDLSIRLRALYCWFTTIRNVAAWIKSVYGYMEKRNKVSHKNFLISAIESEIQNTIELKKLCDTNINFMSVSGQGETKLMHSDNFKLLLDKRIRLMKKHVNDEPFIDHNYIYKISGKPIK